MQRMGMMIGLNAGKVAEYKRLHAAVWPEILELISSCNIRNYTIFLREPENVLFGTWEYHGDRFQGRYGKDGCQPEEQGMVGCVHALPGAACNAGRRRVVGDDGRSLPSRLMRNIL